MERGREYSLCTRSIVDKVVVPEVFLESSPQVGSGLCLASQPTTNRLNK